MNESTSSTGAGQQQPWDSDHDFNAAMFAVRMLLAQMDTMKLVQVQAVTGGGGAIAAAGTVDVLPLVNQIDGAGNATSHGTVYGIPWWRMQGGDSALICDPAVGDIGYVAISDRDISSVKTNKARSNPGSLRKFDIADGVYVGGVLNDVPVQYLVFDSNGSKWLDRNGNSITLAAAGINITDKNGNSAVLSASGVVLTDLTGNVITMSSTGIAITPHGVLPTTVTGVLQVSGNLQIGGLIQAIGGGLYTGAINTAGAIIAGFGTGDQVGLQTHRHLYDRPAAGATIPTPSQAPTAGS